MKRVIVTGGRNFNDRALVAYAFGYLLGNDRQDVTIVHGDAPGADTIAAEVAETVGYQVEPHPADWKRYRNGAGPIRNAEMIDTGADLVIAFPGGRGTANCCSLAEVAGIEVVYAAELGSG